MGFVFLSASIVVNVSDLVFFSNPSEINGNAEKQTSPNVKKVQFFLLCFDHLLVRY